MKKYRLVVAYDKRVISVTFDNIKNLDEFTETYENGLELGKMLNEILKLNIPNVKVDKVYIEKVQVKENENGIREYQDYYPVKYLGDNFDAEDTKVTYIKYFLDNYKEFEHPPVGLDKVKNNYMKKHNKTNLTVNDICYIVSLFLDNNYERYRNAYFTLKNNGYKVKIDKMEFKTPDRTNLSDYSVTNTYSDSLARYASLGEEEHAKAMDTLSGYDLEELKKMFISGEYDLFDGLSGGKTGSKNVDDEKAALFALSNMSLSELTELVENYGDKHTKGRKR